MEPGCAHSCSGYIVAKCHLRSVSTATVDTVTMHYLCHKYSVHVKCPSMHSNNQVYAEFSYIC